LRPQPLKALAVSLALVLALAGGCRKKPAAEANQAAALYTGKEAKRKVLLTFPAKSQAGFVTVERQIYATASVVNQGKQVMALLMQGPSPRESQAAAPFGPGAQYRELFLDGKGLAVLDLPAAALLPLPGGTSSEVATLYSVVRSLAASVPGVGRVQFLVDGQRIPSFHGHVDILDPLALADF
jgi:hypothetical protein